MVTLCIEATRTLCIEATQTPCIEPRAKRPRNVVVENDASAFDRERSNARKKWNDRLLPELMARVSSFLDLAGVRNLIYTMDGDLAGTIRTSYLMHNFLFLEEAAAVRQSEPRLRRLRSWMQINDDWRDMYDREWFDRSERMGEPLDERDRSRFSSTLGDLLRCSGFGALEAVRHLVEVRGMDANGEVVADDSLNQRPWQGEQNHRPVSRALLHPDPSVLGYLLSLDGIDPNFVFQPVSGCRLLHFAAADARVPPANLRRLLAHPAVDADAPDARGRTPLHCVCMYLPRDAACRVRHLLEAGADPNARGNSMRTPWEIMEIEWGVKRRSRECEDIIALLREAGGAEPGFRYIFSVGGGAFGGIGTL